MQTIFLDCLNTYQKSMMDENSLGNEMSHLSKIINMLVNKYFKFLNTEIHNLLKTLSMKAKVIQ